ncbi:MAG: phosphoadenosine phosphosulfate reductase family protein [Proteobacteria bacterium]|nr:phosphoadenosine phosphosulfate reductase family protein [Pseudomonadota bacterium]
MSRIDVVSTSGGKDSTAAYLECLERTGGDFLAVFADTGNEHPAVYEYLAELPRRTGGPEIRTVRADFSGRIEKRRAWLQSDAAERRGWKPEQIARALDALHPSGTPFLDACLWKGLFPSRKRQFCTEFLKRAPILTEVQEPLILAGHEVWSWQGVRADESLNRSKYAESAPSPELEGLTDYRPLLTWTVQDVVAMHHRHGIPLNPLYSQGFGRVGCFPCINANKAELRLIAREHTWAIDKIREWEVLVRKASKGQLATFFHQSHTSATTPQQIDGVARWSMTRRGGKTFDLMAHMPSPTCVLAGGLCE